MSPGVWPRLCARLSRVLMRLTVALLAAPHASWGRAMQAELAAVDRGDEALAFAWGCLRTAIAVALTDVAAALTPAHRAGLAACTTTVLLGGIALLAAGAPAPLAGMNLASLLVAVLGLGLLPLRRWQHDEVLRARLCAGGGALLLATALNPLPGSGASPWLHAGPVHLNLMWLLLPALLVAADTPRRTPTPPGALAGLLMATAALGLLAEGALAGLVASVIGLRAVRSRSPALAWIAAGAAATALHVGGADTEATRFVDGVVHAGFEHSLSLGLALAMLQLLPLWPALRHRCARPHGIVWAGLVALSFAGLMPSPLVGFGGSLIAGYLLSLALLPADRAPRPRDHPAPAQAGVHRDPPAWPRSGLT